LGAVLFVFYLLTTSAHPPYGDEDRYLEVAENIIASGTPAIAGPPNGAGQVQNIAYSKFPLGQSLLLLPFAAISIGLQALFGRQAAVASHFVVHALPAAEAAAICALLFLLIRLLGGVRPDLDLSPRTAAALAMTAAVGTQIWPASRTLFADTSVAFFIMLTVYSLLRFRYADTGIGWAIAAGWTAAGMFLCKNLLALAWPGLILYGFWAVKERKREGHWISQRQTVCLAVATAVPFLLAIAAQLWYNNFRYGSVWLSGYHEGRDADLGFSTPLFAGLDGIFLSSGRSLFLYSPPCVLAFLGARRFLKNAPAEAALIAGVAVPVTLVYAKWWAWHAGWEWGSRFYLFMIPLLMWISSSAWQRGDWSTGFLRFRRLALAFLIIVSLSVQGLGILIHPAAYWVLTAREVAPFNYPVYQKGSWEIRDDMALAHFVPEFSPVAAHAWLVWATWNNHRLGDEALAQSAPWYSFNPRWAPKNVRPYLGFDLWFYGDWSGAELTRYALAAFLGSLLLFSSWRFRASVDRPS
jgi:hypothetical protein